MNQNSDLELLEEIDNHEADCNAYESERVERLLKWVRPGRNAMLSPGRPLRLHDRKWARELLEQLDERL